MEISPVEEELFHEDRRTDMTKLTVSCRNFSNGLKKLLEMSLSPLQFLDKRHAQTPKMRVVLPKHI